MKKIMKHFLVILNLWRVVPVWILLLGLNKESKNDILFEMRYWEKCLNISESSCFFLLGRLLIYYKEYRNLIQHRLRRLTGGGIIKSTIVKILFPPLETLYIFTNNIGVPLYIQHGFSTVIAAKEIGKYCWINQQVTVGWTFDDESPIIGNGVRITAGAKVLGKITVGNNVIVGANAVVVKDVSENDIVVGVPAKPIRKNLDHKLYICKY